MLSVGLPFEGWLRPPTFVPRRMKVPTILEMVSLYAFFITALLIEVYGRLNPPR